MNLIILTEKDRIDETQFRISGERFIHITNILKSEIGNIVEVGLLNGPTGSAKIIVVNNSEIILKIIQLNEIVEHSNQIDIICALPRPQTLKKVLSICATMGVTNLFLIRSEKVEKSYFHSPLLKEENYTKFLIEGLSQGKHTTSPKVSVHNLFKKFFQEDFSKTNNYQLKLLAHPNTDVNLSHFEVSQTDKIVLAIGPEGGWNDFEIDFMIQNGFDKFVLSKNILRVESAVTAALAQIELLQMN
jgi:16S rRNA (uracil1498-N3)-methyltransferase